MNIKSAELLNQSLQNAADNIYRNRALEASMQEEAQRNAVEQSFRNAMMQHYTNIEQKQAETAALQEQRLAAEDNAANQPKVSADLVDPESGARMTFAGTAGQLNGMLASARAQGKNLKVTNQKGYAATFNVGGATYAFEDPDDADKFVQGMRAKGIDVYSGQYGGAGGGKSRMTNPGDNADFGRQVSQAPQRLANSIAQADSNVPKDPDTGKPTLPVTTNPADAQRMGVLAGQLAAAGVASPIQTATGLIYGTNATVRPNITGSAGSVLDPNGNSNGSGPATGPATNSFTLTPGGISQDALANVQNSPGGPAILKSFGLVPDMGNTAVNTNGISTGRPAASTFNSPTDVRDAYNAGKIDKPTATQILQTKFGMP